MNLKYKLFNIKKGLDHYWTIHNNITLFSFLGCPICKQHKSWVNNIRKFYKKLKK
jgi:hypothetical protein